MYILSYPKVNLTLDILRKDKSGLHEIRTVFHELRSPKDEIEIKEDADIKVECDNTAVPVDGTNTVFKAAQLLQKAAYIKRGAHIFIKKKIPLMSGLGGGASNAAAALKALAQLWRIKCCASGDHRTPNCLLQQIAMQIGMDVPFFFYGGTALGEHFGEKITPLPNVPNALKFEIMETGVKVSSHAAYSRIDVKNCGKNVEKTERLIRALYNGDAKGILENMHNDFEKFEYKKVIPDSTLLCGSGGCFFRCWI